MAQTEKPHARTASTEHRLSWSWKRLFGKDDNHNTPPASTKGAEPRPGLARRLSRKVVPGLPRPGTFKRQQSELRDRLVPVQPNPDERRTVSVDRRRNGNASFRDSNTAIAPPRVSAPDFLETVEPIGVVRDSSKLSKAPTNEEHNEKVEECADIPRVEVEVPNEEVQKEPSPVDTQSISTEAFDEMILEELEKRWILNLSMHFRDKSKREKFFVTFAETPTHWRRVTISLDYRNAPEGSLEEELQRTRFQRDKSARIYEAIRESLPDIQFYETVTNLKLQTENERLHVHVVEDLSEIISYPSVRSINHLNCRRVREQDLVFDSHLSGFVYKVNVGGQVFIKKEIPGPDTVDEFLYEINALHQLSGSHSVIQFGGVVLDNKGETVKGLLISFAEQGALIDVIYDGEGRIPWSRRERWAKQIVQGLSEIHEAGFVQGDFTLSNIVIDGHDNAKIIDINRRGCPVGWEPPEVAALIDSNQRISMYIGVKSDLYQLGMVLFALATQQDEPENHRPFNFASLPTEIPDYFLDVCLHCLSDDPRRRSQATTLLSLFPKVDEIYSTNRDPIPIVVDACYPDTEPHSPYQSGKPFELKGFDPHYIQNPGLETPINVYDYAVTDTSEEPDYFPRRGRSPPAPFRFEAAPSEIPLPRSSSGSSYQDIDTIETPSAHNTLNFSTLASLDEYQRDQQDIRDPYMEVNPILTLEQLQEAALSPKHSESTMLEKPRHRTIPELPSTPESVKPQNIPLPPMTSDELNSGTFGEMTCPDGKHSATYVAPEQSPTDSPYIDESEEGQKSVCPDPLMQSQRTESTAIPSDLPNFPISQDSPKEATSEDSQSTIIPTQPAAPPTTVLPKDVPNQSPASTGPTLPEAALKFDTAPFAPDTAGESKLVAPEKSDPAKQEPYSSSMSGPLQNKLLANVLWKTNPKDLQPKAIPGALPSLTGLEKTGYAALSSGLSKPNHISGTQDSRELARTPPDESHSVPNHQNSPPSNRNPPTTTSSSSAEPRLTVAAAPTTAATIAHLNMPTCPPELAGIGMGHGPVGGQFGFHPASLDDDFMTDMHYDRIAETSSATG